MFVGWLKNFVIRGSATPLLGTGIAVTFGRMIRVLWFVIFFGRPELNSVNRTTRLRVGAMGWFLFM